MASCACVREQVCVCVCVRGGVGGVQQLFKFGCQNHSCSAAVSLRHDIVFLVLNCIKKCKLKLIPMSVYVIIVSLFNQPLKVLYFRKTGVVDFFLSSRKVV